MVFQIRPEMNNISCPFIIMGGLYGTIQSLGYCSQIKLLYPPHSIMKKFKQSENVQTYWKFERLVQQITICPPPNSIKQYNFIPQRRMRKH